MLASIAENRLFEFISIKHGAEISEGEIREHTNRTDAFENYSFSEKDGVTTVQVDLDVTEDFGGFMEQAWPKALEMLREISEKKGPLITVSAGVYAPVDKVRNAWTTPADIMQRNHASDDWHTPKAENDLRV